jgi:hypothetical protein
LSLHLSLGDDNGLQVVEQTLKDVQRKHGKCSTFASNRIVTSKCLDVVEHVLEMKAKMKGVVSSQEETGPVRAKHDGARFDTRFA